MKRLMVCVLTSIAALGAGAPGDVDDATRTALLKECSAATTKILKVYEQIKLECKETKVGGVEEPWTYARDGKSTRWMTVDPKSGKSYALVADPTLSFKLHRDSAAEQYSVTRRSVAQRRSDETSIEVRSLPAFAPYRAYLECPAATFLADPNCSILEIVVIGQAPNRIVRVDWEMNPTTPQGKVRFGTFEFLPDSAWLLKSYSIYFRGGYKDEATGQFFDTGRGAELTYEGQCDGIPLVHKVATWTSAKERAEGPAYEVTKIVSGPVPRAEFTLESFGDVITPPPHEHR